MPALGDPELSRFIENHVLSFAHWDLLAILSRQSMLPADVGQLAQLTGRSEIEVEKAVRQLETSGLLVPDTDAGRKALRVDDIHRAILDKFVAAIEDREKRLHILTKVLANRTTS